MSASQSRWIVSVFGVMVVSLLGQSAVAQTATSALRTGDKVRLSAPEPQANARFASSIAIDGDYAVVGSPATEVDGTTSAGAVFLFKRVDGSWLHRETKTQAPPVESGNFGQAVAVDGDLIVVASNNTQADVADYNVYERQGSSWMNIDSFTTSLSGITLEHGTSLAVRGDTIFVGEGIRNTTTNAPGLVRIFSRSGTSWSESQMFRPGEGDNVDDMFGESIAVDGRFLAVGAPGVDDGETTDAGAAYVYSESGGTWVQQQVLRPSVPQAYARFGASVAVSSEGTPILVGSPSPAAYSPARPGSTHVFEMGCCDWSYESSLSACDETDDNEFGSSVAVRDDRAVVGADRAYLLRNGNRTRQPGAAYLYVPGEESGWNHQEKIAFRGPSRFGSPIDMGADRLFIGAPQENFQSDGGELLTTAGAAYVLPLESGLPSEESVCERSSSPDAGMGPDAGMEPDVGIGPDVGLAPDATSGGGENGSSRSSSESSCSTTGSTPVAPLAAWVVGLIFVLFRRREV